MMKKSVCLIGCVLGALLVGCVEEETNVSIPTSAIGKVSSGQIEYVEANYILGYESKEQDDEMLHLMRDARRVMLRHLGKGGEIKIEKDAYGYWFKASFRVPFGKESALGKAQKSIMVLVMGADGKIALRDGPGLALLNRDFKEQNICVEDDEPIQWKNAGRLTYFRFMGSHNRTPKIIEAPTNDMPVAISQIDDVIVKFNGSVWHSQPPFVFLQVGE